MNKADVEFTVGLNTSPAEQKLDEFYKKINNKRNTFQILDTNLSNEPSDIIPTPPKNIKTTNDFGDNLPITSITRDLEKIISYMHYRSQGVSGWRYAGYSNANEQKRIGYDNLPSKDTLPTYEQNRVSGWKYAGYSSTEQKKLAYDNLPELSVGSKLQDTIEFIYEQQESPKWRYAGSSRAKSVYEDFENLGKQPLLLEDKTSEKINYVNHPWKDKRMEEINKKDNVELKEKLLLWSKILLTIYAIKKVISGLVKAWKFSTDTVTSRNANINEESGFFSTDPIGAMRTNIDRTRAILYAGIRNLGDNAPVSKAGLDYTANKFTEMWTAAMSGRNVDARTTIDAQRLKEFFGLDLTVAGLLTGEREGKTATDIQLDAMKKIEQNLTKLNEADEITKGQVIDSLKNILGEETINAIIANYNKNLKLDTQDLKLTVAERIFEAGSSALSPQDLTEKTTLAVTALSDFKDSLETLKNTIVVDFAPAFSSVTKTMTTFVDWLNRVMTKKKGDKDETGAFISDVTPEAIGSARQINWIAKTADQGNIFGSKSNRAIKANDLLKTATNANDILDAIYLINPFVQTEGDIENLKSRKFIREAGEALLKGDIDSNSSNPYIRKIANYQYGELTGAEAFKLAFSRGEFGNINEMGFLQSLLLSPESFEDKSVADFLPKNYEKLEGKKKDDAYQKALKALEKYTYYKNQKKYAAINQFMETNEFGKWVTESFGEGGEFDLKENESIAGYLFNPKSYNTPDEYYNALKSLKESFDANNWGREYIQSFELPSKESLAGSDKKLDFGEVRFKIILTDQGENVIGSKELVGSVQ